MDFGVEAAGGHVIFSNDILADACKTLEKYFPGADIRNADISGIQAFPDADIVVGGYPCQSFSMAGNRQDSERALPTPQALWRRRVLGRGETRVDWVNAACLVLPRSVWHQLGGFDETYFMYCEDVDLCLRLRLLGFALALAPARVVHAGQHASHRRWRHLRWHVQSLLRLWRSPVFKQACRLLR